MIYDFFEGFNNATVMVADSGRISKLGEDKKYLLLTLYDHSNLKSKALIPTLPTSHTGVNHST